MKRSVLRVAVAVVVSALAGGGGASANGRFPAAQMVVLGPGARAYVIALRTTFGLIVSTDGGATFRWYCEDLLYFPFVPGSGFDPPVEVTARGEIVVGFEDGAHALTDGCAVRSLGTVLHHDVVDLAATPDGTVIYGAESTAGAPAYVLRSDDSLFFERRGAGLANVQLLTVEVAPSRPDRVYASGFDDSAARAPRLFRSDDGGATLTATGIGAALGDEAFVSGVDPTAPSTLFVRTVDGLASNLLRSTDGGDHLGRVAGTADDMTGFAISDDGRSVWYGSAGAGLFRSTDGGETFARVNALPVLGMRWHAGSLWVVTDWLRQPFALGRSDDGGATVRPVLRFSAVLGPPVCAAPSEGTQVCIDRWSAVSTTIADTPRPDAGVARDAAVAQDAPVDAGILDASLAGIVDVPTLDAPRTGASAPSTSCGCSVPGATRDVGVEALSLAMLAAATRRRRRRVSIATGLQ